MKSTCVVVALAGVVCATEADAELRVRCTEGCAATTSRTLNALVREDAGASVTLRWSMDSDPSSQSRRTLLYAGNPTLQDSLRDRGELVFTPSGDELIATKTFDASELGGGTFLAIVTARKRGETRRDDGANETILDWRPFRLTTRAEEQKKNKFPAPGDGYALSITPAFIQVDTGRGPLPKSSDSTTRTWLPLIGQDADLTNVDLDGDNSGIPGLGIVRSAVWESRGDHATIKDQVLKLATGVAGHRVRFETLDWVEQPTRTAQTDAGPLEIKEFYAVITLFTRATTRRFRRDDVIDPRWHLFDERYFSHETSARLALSADPRFWPSYDPREYGANKRLLQMLSRQLRARGEVNGLSGIQVEDGDGGPPNYHAAFSVATRPWKSALGHSRASAGVVAVEVVAARRGIGGIEAEVATRSAMCQVVGCDQEAEDLNLRKPPSGYRVTDAFALLGTMPGIVDLAQTLPVVADRFSEAEAVGRITLPPELDTEPEPMTDGFSTGEATSIGRFPQQGRFAISAQLRAGALLREESWGRVSELTPINTYAQFVIRMTVALIPGTPIDSAKKPEIPGEEDQKGRGNVPFNETLLGWIQSNALAVTSGGLFLAVLVVAVIVGGPIQGPVMVLKWLARAVTAPFRWFGKRKSE